MLADKTLSTLAEAAGVKPDELREAWSSDEEKELEIKPAQRFSDDEINTRVRNELTSAIQRYAQQELDGATIAGDTPEDMIHALGKNVYEDSKSAALEMWVKDWKEKNGADFQGKDPSALINYIKSQKQDTGELESTIEKLRSNLQEKESELEQTRNDFEKKLTRQQTDELIRRNIPDNLIDTIKKDHVHKLFQATYEVDMQNGNPVVKENGEVLKDRQLLEPLKLEQVMERFIQDNGWAATERHGRGGGDQRQKPTGLEGIHDKESFEAYLSDNKIKFTSREAVNVVNKLPKEVQKEILTHE